MDKAGTMDTPIINSRSQKRYFIFTGSQFRRILGGLTYIRSKWEAAIVDGKALVANWTIQNSISFEQ